MRTLFTVIIISFLTKYTYCQTDSIHIKQNSYTINNISFADYLGKEVYNLLLNDSIRKFQFTVYENEPPTILNGMLVSINANFYIRVYINKFKYLKRKNSDLNWDLALFYKEIIDRIIVYIDNKCILDIELLSDGRIKNNELDCDNINN